MAIDIDLDWAGFDYPLEADFHGETISPADALVRSVRDCHRVDMPYIAHLSGLTEDAAADALGGAVFLDPETETWELSSAYLAGDLGHKLEVAKAACESDERFERNVSALKKAMPSRVPASEIYVSLGAPWVPAEVIVDFIHHLMPASNRVRIDVLHDSKTGSWNIKGKGTVKRWPGSMQVWGTKRMPVLELLEDSLNGRDARVYDEEDCPTNWSGVKKVINHGDTLEALEKQRHLNEEFEKWVWTDAERAKRLEDIFNRRYCTYAMQRFDGSCLEFPGMSSDIELYPYQRDAVMHMLLKRNVLLCHDCGSGKTFEMICAGILMIRDDPSEKLLYVVPNNVVGQWASMFATVYPDADVLVVDPKAFAKDRRQGVLGEIQGGHHDAVVIAQSSFDLIPLSKKFKSSELDARIAELDEALADPKRATTAVKRERAACVKRLDKLAGCPEGYDGICFDELGITRLFVDEAHNYKNLAAGARSSVQGICSKGSRKCAHMLEAVRFTARSGGGVVFATGTVLVNSVADAFTFMTYLMPAALSILDIKQIDAWLAMFAERRTSWEIDVDTSTFKLSSRFSGFGNLEALTVLLGQVCDFHHMAPGGDLPECAGRTDVVVGKTPELAAYLQQISKRADRVRRGLVRRKDDNLLKICSDGRRAALDVRLVDDEAKPGWNCKVGVCAATIARIWQETADISGTQLVFCDISTPREGFNVYDELKQTLVALGIPEGQIAFVHDATTERARERLFADVRAGEVRVLVGSTPKMGIGVNVQDRCVAAHHLDVPWRPADMVQREGRIIRQGNTNSEVAIYRYVTEGSFSAYSWQLLESKQHAIDELLSGTYEGGWLDSDIGDTALSFGEIKALAVGNPMLRERVETANELERLRVLQRRGAATRARLAEEVDDLVRRIGVVEAEIEVVAADENRASAHPAPHMSRDERRAAGTSILRQVAKNALGYRDRRIGAYRGFDLVVPAGMQPAQPNVLLTSSGRWPVDLGEGKALGVLARLDNAIEGLAKHREELLSRLEILYRNWEQAEGELAGNGGDFTTEIDRLKARLAQIDMQLEEETLKKEADQDEQ